MALLGLFGAKKVKKQIRCKKGRGNTYEIVGEAFYQANLLALTGGQKEEFGVKQDVQATLQPEPSNPHDANAVAVIIKKKTVGYLSKSDAPVFAAFLKEVGADSALCEGRIVGGWDDRSGNEGHFGVKLSLSWPPKQAS